MLVYQTQPASAHALVLSDHSADDAGSASYDAHGPCAVIDTNAPMLTSRMSARVVLYQEGLRDCARTTVITVKITQQTTQAVRPVREAPRSSPGALAVRLTRTE